MKTYVHQKKKKTVYNITIFIDCSSYESKRPKHPSINEWLNPRCYGHTRDFLAIKRNKGLMYAARTSLKIMLSQRSLTLKVLTR